MPVRLREQHKGTVGVSGCIRCIYFPTLTLASIPGFFYLVVYLIAFC